MEVILTGENSMDVQVGDSIITKNRIPAATALSLCCAWEWISVSAVPNADGRSWCRAAKLKKHQKVVREALPL